METRSNEIWSQKSKMAVSEPEMQIFQQNSHDRNRILSVKGNILGVWFLIFLMQLVSYVSVGLVSPCSSSASNHYFLCDIQRKHEALQIAEFTKPLPWSELHISWLRYLQLFEMLSSPVSHHNQFYKHGNRLYHRTFCIDHIRINEIHTQKSPPIGGAR